MGGPVAFMLCIPMVLAIIYPQSGSVILFNCLEACMLVTCYYLIVFQECAPCLRSVTETYYI